MSDDDKFATFLGSAAVVAFIIGMTCVAWLAILDATSEERRFENICTYLDGVTQGNVCIKGGEIIETIDVAQDPPRD